MAWAYAETNSTSFVVAQVFGAPGSAPGTSYHPPSSIQSFLIWSENTEAQRKWVFSWRMRRRVSNAWLFPPKALSINSIYPFSTGQETAAALP